MDARRGGTLALGIACLVGGAAVTRYFLRSHSLPDASRDIERSNRIATDLLDDWRRVRVLRDTAVIEFGAADSRGAWHEPDPRLHGKASGILSRDFGPGKRAGFACGDAVEVAFTRLGRGGDAGGADVDARLLALGLDDGKGPQDVTVRVRGFADPIARFELAAPGTPSTPQEVAFTIPGSRLARGENALVFEFGRTLLRGFEGVPTKLPLAAVLVRLELAAADGRDAAAAAPGPAGADVAVEEVASPGGGPPRRALVFHEGERLAMPLRLDAGAPRFVATLYVHPDDGAPRRVAISSRLRAAPQGMQRIVFAELDATAGNPRDRAALEIDVDLSTYASSVAAIEIDSPPPPAGEPPLRLALAAPAIRGGRVIAERKDPPEPDATDLHARLAGSNVVIVLLDAAGARHFSAYGARQEFAPVCDTIAAEGIVFDATTTPASYTLPAVGSLFTGLHPEHHGVTEAGGETEKRRLPAAARTLAERFKAAGYRTAAIVSNPNAGPEPGYDRGFDAFDRLYDDPALWNEGVAPEAVVERVARRIADGALDEPFFLYAHFFPPHAPYRPPEEHRRGIVDDGYGGRADGSRDSIEAWRRRGQEYAARDAEHLRQLYDANLHHVDGQVGELLALLARSGRLDRTIFVVVGDHGEAFLEHDNLEHGDTVYGEEIEVPWILRLPRDLGWKPSRARGPCSLLDVAPTLLSLVSIAAPAVDFDGSDLAYRLFERRIAVRPAERPLVSRSAGFAPRYALRMLGHSYHEDLFTRERRLYDLVADPLEQRPLPVAGSPMADYLRLELCRFLCDRGRTGPGETFTLPDEQLAKQREIGYVAGQPDGARTAGTCPLLLR